MAKASDDILEALHCAVADDLLNKVRSGEASAQELNAAIKFLKDNGIEATKDSQPKLGHIQSALPTFDDEEDEFGRTLQ